MHLLAWCHVSWLPKLLAETVPVAFSSRWESVLWRQLEDDADFETADENEDDDNPKISDEPNPEMNAIMEPVKDDEDELPWQAVVIFLH